MDTEKLRKSINEKIAGAVLFEAQYTQIAEAYREHIFGDATIAKPKTKDDFRSYYESVKELFGFSRKELEYLAENPDRKSLIKTTEQMLDRDEAGKRVLEEILAKENEFRYSRLVDAYPYLTEKKESRKEPVEKQHQKQDNPYTNFYSRKPGRRKGQRGRRK